MHLLLMLCPNTKFLTPPTCLKYFASSNESVVASAITALGHIARRHGKLDKDIAFAALEEAKTRFPSLEGVIADTLDDIEAFT